MSGFACPRTHARITTRPSCTAAQWSTVLTWSTQQTLIPEFLSNWIQLPLLWKQENIVFYICNYVLRLHSNLQMDPIWLTADMQNECRINNSNRFFYTSLPRTADPPPPLPIQSGSTRFYFFFPDDVFTCWATNLQLSSATIFNAEIKRLSSRTFRTRRTGKSDLT